VFVVNLKIWLIHFIEQEKVVEQLRHHIHMNVKSVQLKESKVERNQR